MISTITAFVPPLSRHVLTSASDRSPREFAQVDDFVACISSKTGDTVRIVETNLSECSPEGFIVAWLGSSLTLSLADFPLTARARLCRRLVWVDAGRTDIKRDLEEFQPACAVLDVRYFEWKTQRDCESGYGLHARRDVAVKQMQLERAQFATGIFDTTHYVYTGNPKAYGSLPELLVGYLGAYEQQYGAV
jgi:hypothetical protein